MKQDAFSKLQSNRTCKVAKSWRRLTALAGLLYLLGVAAPVYAGGGGENMLLIVNPNDETSLRIANAYVQARHIPVNNILYIAPPRPLGFRALRSP
jgi:hypothetical protein